jgi:hypothetical protein
VAPFVAIVALIPRALPLGRLTKLARARGEAATLLHAMPCFMHDFMVFED